MRMQQIGSGASARRSRHAPLPSPIRPYRPCSRLHCIHLLSRVDGDEDGGGAHAPDGELEVVDVGRHPCADQRGQHRHLEGPPEPGPGQEGATVLLDALQGGGASRWVDPFTRKAGDMEARAAWSTHSHPSPPPPCAPAPSSHHKVRLLAALVAGGLRGGQAAKGDGGAGRGQRKRRPEGPLDGAQRLPGAGRGGLFALSIPERRPARCGGQSLAAFVDSRLARQQRQPAVRPAQSSQPACLPAQYVNATRMHLLKVTKPSACRTRLVRYITSPTTCSSMMAPV